jgi:hypothetical protein
MISGASNLHRFLIHSLVCIVLVIGLVASAAAQEVSVQVAPAQHSLVTAAATPNCLGGLAHDDGSFESSIKISDNGAPANADLVQLFNGPAADQRIDQICVCWRRDPGAPMTLSHDILIFAADGPVGTPGTLVDVIPAQADLPIGQSFASYDISGDDVLTPGANFYAGVRWISGATGGDGYALCSDLSGSTVQPTYFKLAGQSDWRSVNSEAELSVSAVGVRAELERQGTEEDCEISTCVEDANTLCLNDGRFRVRTAFDPANDDDTIFEAGNSVPLRSDSGYFWFFDEDNVEVVVKVLDACNPFNRYWVFAAGLTNVETVINVCDTETGVPMQYVNPQSTPFEAIQDTDAFATCP